MNSTAIREFATILAERVRDTAIRACDVNLQENSRSPSAARWREAKTLGFEAFAKAIIPDIVDETIFNLLDAIDNGNLRLSFEASSGDAINLAEEGGSEMAGYWVMGGSSSWRSRYSKERFADDFADLNPD